MGERHEPTTVPCAQEHGGGADGGGLPERLPCGLRLQPGTGLRRWAFPLPPVGEGRCLARPVLCRGLAPSPRCRHPAAAPTESRAFSACQALSQADLLPTPPRGASGGRLAEAGRQAAFIPGSSAPSLAGLCLGQPHPAGVAAGSASSAHAGSAARSHGRVSRSRHAWQGGGGRRRVYLGTAAVFGLVVALFPRCLGRRQLCVASAWVLPVPRGSGAASGRRLGGPPRLCPQNRGHVGLLCPRPLGCSPLCVLLGCLGSRVCVPPGLCAPHTQGGHVGPPCDPVLLSPGCWTPSKRRAGSCLTMGTTGPSSGCSWPSSSRVR